LRIKSSNTRAAPIEEPRDPNLLYVREISAGASQNMRSQSLGKRSNHSGVMTQGGGVIVGIKGQLSKTQSTQ